MPHRILVVEDTDDIRDALAIAFTEEGFRVAAAARGEEAFEELASFSPDIILLDMHLPGISGTEILRRIRQTLRVPVLMYTNSDAGEVVREAIVAGANDYVLKDSGMDELLSRVYRHLDQAQQAGITAGPIAPKPEEHVVFIGNDAAVFRTVSETARRIGASSVNFGQLDEAIVSSEKKRPAAIVVDLDSADEDALDALMELSAGGESPIAVIATASSASPLARRSAVRKGAYAFYTKPLSGFELQQALRRLFS